MAKSKRFTNAQFRALDEVRRGVVTAVHQESPHMGKLRYTWYVDGVKQHSPLTYDWLLNQGFISEGEHAPTEGWRYIIGTRKGEIEHKTQLAMLQHRMNNAERNMAKTAAARKAQGQATD